MQAAIQFVHDQQTAAFEHIEYRCGQGIQTLSAFGFFMQLEAGAAAFGLVDELRHDHFFLFARDVRTVWTKQDFLVKSLAWHA